MILHKQLIVLTVQFCIVNQLAACKPASVQQHTIGRQVVRQLCESFGGRQMEPLFRRSSPDGAATTVRHCLSPVTPTVRFVHCGVVRRWPILHRRETSRRMG